MHLTPLENFKRWVVSSPPWVIFTISLAIMACGILILACRLRNDSGYMMQPNMATVYYCVVSKSEISSSQRATHNSSTKESSLVLPIFVSLKNDVYYNLVNKSGNDDDSITWLGALHDGQLGLRGTNSNSTLQLEVVLGGKMARTCVDETCDYVLIDACAFAHNVAEDNKEAHAVFDVDDGNTECKNRKNVISAGNTDATIRNWLDAPSHPSDQSMLSTPSSHDNWCWNGSVVTVQRRDARGLVLIPLLHDTLTARLHLLYTSYFLFTATVILIIYAACRRSSRAKQSVRTLESGTYSNYSKITDEHTSK